MKNQALFPSKDKSEKLKCHLLHFFFGSLRVKSICLLYIFFKVTGSFPLSFYFLRHP